MSAPPLVEPPDSDHVENISFAPLEDPGLEVVDPIDRHRYALYTTSPVVPEPVDAEAFRFPVDAAIGITAESITLPNVVAVCVRDADGEMIAKAEHFAFEEFDRAEYSLELCAPIRIYLRVEASVTVTADAERTRIAFDEPKEVRVGARSKHESPIATVTTTDDPVDVMAAVSTFGSALKTTSPERSYPTFRGHPPAIERGDELAVPKGLEPPETGVRIEVPPDHRYAYVVAPLAYYLGSRVEPGDELRLVTDRGFAHSLDGHAGFEREVERVLKQTFFLDCLTRTEGLYRVDLHERRQVEEGIDLDFESLYHRPLAEQLEAYLSVPFAEIEPHLPEWKLTAHAEPEPESVETLPYLVNDLAVIRTPRSRSVPASDATVAAVDEFLRDSFLRGAAESAPECTYVEPETADSVEQAWIGDQTPIGVSKATSTAYRNRFDRTPSSSDIGITVVCNDTAMDEERGLVDEVYGSRTELPFAVTVRRDLTTAELADALAAETELIHYIGHIDERGFECPDGHLDAATLDEVGVDAFILNACQSYDQGMSLIDAGAIGGIATLSPVVNDGAVRIGCAVARLLNCGFPLRAALQIARDESIVGSKYIVVGDGGLTIAQAEGGTPLLCDVERTGRAEFTVTMEAFATTSGGMGGMFMPLFRSIDEYYLNSGELAEFEVSSGELENFLQLHNLPLIIDGELHWSSDIGIEEI